MFKLKDKNGIILNVATKTTYHSLLSTGNYTKVENTSNETNSQENNSIDNSIQNKENKPRK